MTEIVEPVGFGDAQVQPRVAVDGIAQGRKVVAGLEDAAVRQIRRLILRHRDAGPVIRVVRKGGSDHGAQRHAVRAEQLVGD